MEERTITVEKVNFHANGVEVTLKENGQIETINLNPSLAVKLRLKPGDKIILRAG